MITVKNSESEFLTVNVLFDVLSAILKNWDKGSFAAALRMPHSSRKQSKCSQTKSTPRDRVKSKGI